MNRNIIFTSLFLIIFIISYSAITVKPHSVPENRSLSNSPWPCFRGNVQNTGLSPYDTDNNTGKLIWKVRVDNNKSCAGKEYSSPAIGTDGTIYLGTQYNEVYAIYPNGTVKWIFKTNDSIHSSPAVGIDDTIYIGSSDSNLYAINPNGSLKWKFKTGNMINASPAMDNNGTIYIGSCDSYFYAIYTNGTLKWKTHFDGIFTSSPAIDTDGIIYVGSMVGYLYAINPDGTIKWKYKTPNRLISSPSLSKDCDIYIGTDYPDNRLYAFNKDGMLKWKLETGYPIRSSPGIGPDGTVYITADDLYAINPNGTIKWKFHTRLSIWFGSSPTISSDGTIYLGSTKSIYAIDSSGKKKWEFNTGNLHVLYSFDKIVASPIIGFDGTLYFHWGHHLFALGETGIVPPSPPQNVKVVSGDRYIKLTWEAPKDDGGSKIIKYRIYQGFMEFVSKNRHVGIRSVNVTQTNYRHTSVMNGTTYYYHVTAINYAGESEDSILVFTTPGEEGDYTSSEESTSSPGFGGISSVILIGILLIVLIVLRLKKKINSRF